jgi:hypothetical protein
MSSSSDKAKDKLVELESKEEEQDEEDEREEDYEDSSRTETEADEDIIKEVRFWRVNMNKRKPLEWRWKRYFYSSGLNE